MADVLECTCRRDDPRGLGRFNAGQASSPGRSAGSARPCALPMPDGRLKVEAIAYMPA